MSKGSANKQKNGHKLLAFKYIPMDMARIVSSVLIPILRLKPVNLKGETYKEKLKGGALIASNHTGYIDTFAVGITFWYRRLYFLAAEVVMKTKLRSFLLKGVGAIKIDRNTTDIEAIVKSVELLRKGHLLAIFPQGKIDKTNDVDSVKSGAALMAIRANVPMVPIYLAPREKWYKSRTVVVGEKIVPSNFLVKKFPTSSDIQKITEALAGEMGRCKAAYNSNFKGE